MWKILLRTSSWTWGGGGISSCIHPSILLAIVLSFITLFSSAFVSDRFVLECYCFQYCSIEEAGTVLRARYFKDISDAIEFASSGSPSTGSLRLGIVALFHFVSQVNVTLDSLQHRPFVNWPETSHPGTSWNSASPSLCPH